MNSRSRILPWIALGIALLLSFAYLFVGLGLINDQFYWIHLCKDYRSSPMSVGTLWLGHMWGSMFSYSLISFRILKWLIELLSLFLACRIAQLRTNSFTVCLCALAIVLIGYGWQNEFGPTAVTNLCVVLVVYAFSLYAEASSKASLAILAIVSGISAVVRFPNIMIVPIVALLIIITGICKQSGVKTVLAHLFAYVAISLAVWWGTTALLLSTLTPIAQMKSSMAAVAQGNHSYSSLINGYLWDFQSFWALLASAFFFGMTIVVYRGQISKPWKLMVSALSVLLFGLFFVKTVGFHKWVNMQLMQFLSASVLILAMVGIYFAIVKKNVTNGILCLAIFMLVFVPTMGSDTRYLKLFPLAVFFLPFLWQTVVGVQKGDLFFLPTGILLVLCALLCLWGNPVASSETSIPLWTCTEKVGGTPLYPIRISKDEAEWVKYIRTASDSYEGTKVSYGFASFFLEYISDGEISVASSKFGDQILEDPFFFESQSTTLMQNNYIFICTMKYSLFEKQLVEAGYVLRDQNSLFKIYSL